jgi:CDGSH-type Zn-finger protein
MSGQPAIGGTAPIPVEVEAGKDYWWCACGKSAKQPFCDGSHKGSGFTPIQFTAPESKKVFFCACKRSAGAPLCDGSHKKLVASA